MTAFTIEQLPWVADGVTGKERTAVEAVRRLAQVDRVLSWRLAGAAWLADGVIDDELNILWNLESLAESDPAIAGPLATVPDRSGQLIAPALTTVWSLLARAPDLAEQLQQQAWFRDGLTEEEAAAIVTLVGVYGTEDVVQELLRGPQVRSATITLPLAGTVDLYAVGRSSRELAGQLERMGVAAAAMEAFLGTPWPKPATIALLELESDLDTEFIEGWNAGDFVVVKNPDEYLTYHELAHFYFDAENRTPLWLNERNG